MSEWEKSIERNCPACNSESEILVRTEKHWDGREIGYIEAERCPEGCYLMEC